MLDKQQEIYEKLITTFYLHDNNVVTIKGNAGVGKTYVANHLVDKLENEKKIDICYINGDPFCKEREYYCIKQALSEVSYKYERKKNDADLISEMVGEFPVISNISKKIVSDKLNYRDVNQNRKAFFLNNDDERNIVYRLNYLFEKKKSLIICDNFQFFDHKSLEMIYLFLKNQAEFDFMRKCHFLIILTTDQEYDSYVDDIIEHFSTAEFCLQPISYDEMDVYLKNFNVKISLENRLKQILFNLSNGHLEVIKQIALRINNPYSNYNKIENKIENYLEELINKNLESMGAIGNEISNLLEYASLVGERFLNEELKKVSNLSRQDYINIIRYSENMDYIITGKPYIHFSHDIIHLVFRNKAYVNNISYYEKMRDCVKELFPGDYKRRIQIELQLDDRYNAAVLSVLLFFKHDFQNFYQKEIYTKIIEEFTDLNEYYSLFQSAVKEYSMQNYKGAIKQLSYISDIYPPQLIVIKEILRSVSLTKLLDNKCRQEAISGLEQYTLENIDGEGDLYLQVLLTLISSYSHNGMIEDAKECEKKIMHYLQPRICYDDNAKSILYALKRISNCMHECILAEKNICQSVKFFAPLPGNITALNPLQYIMSLTNHTGILIECGRYQEALCEIEKAYSFINSNPTICFPRLYIIDNNFLIAMYLYKPDLKEKILETYKKLIELSENADHIFLISNYASLLSINGEIDAAYELLIETRNKATNNSESFYEICIENNILILELYRKNYIQAKKILNKLFTATNSIIDESYYKKKYELLQLIIDQKPDISIERIDTFIFEYCQKYQDAWNYWGHSFDFTALYYWSNL